MNKEPDVRIWDNSGKYTHQRTWDFLGPRDEIPDKYKVLVALIDAVDREAHDSIDVESAQIPGVGSAYYSFYYDTYYLGA